MKYLGQKIIIIIIFIRHQGRNTHKQYTKYKKVKYYKTKPKMVDRQIYTVCSHTVKYIKYIYC